MNKQYFKPGTGVVEDPETVDDDMVELVEWYKDAYDEGHRLDDEFDGTIRKLTAEEKTERARLLALVKRARLLALVKQANKLLAEAEKGGVDVWPAIRCWPPLSRG